MKFLVIELQQMELTACLFGCVFFFLSRGSDQRATTSIGVARIFNWGGGGGQNLKNLTQQQDWIQKVLMGDADLN